MDRKERSARRLRSVRVAETIASYSTHVAALALKAHRARLARQDLLDQQARKEFKAYPECRASRDQSDPKASPECRVSRDQSDPKAYQEFKAPQGPQDHRAPEFRAHRDLWAQPDPKASKA